MENTGIYEPPRGGRISSPQFRGLARISEEFEGLPEGVSRFDLLNLVKNVGPAIGFTPRMISLLEYYLVFTRESDWLEGGRPIVYQSQAKTAKHFSVSERQIQYVERALFNIGALTFDTAANNKRFGYRSQSGELLHASGVDLAPLAALREKLELKKEEIQLEDAAWFKTKSQISWHRGRIRALIAEADEQPALKRASAEAQHAYNGINGHIRTYMGLSELLDLLKAHKTVHDQLLAAIEAHVPAKANCGQNSSLTEEYSSRDDKNFAHKYYTKHSKFSKENTSSSPMDKIASEGSVAAPSETKSSASTSGETYKAEWMAALSEEMGRISWKQVLASCSERFKEQFPMIHGRPLGWNDIVDAAYGLLPTLGISKSAWIEACMVLGRDGAALTIMIIDRKAQDTSNPIHSPGGYLRGMTEKAKKGELNLHRSIFGLLKKREDGNYDA